MKHWDTEIFEYGLKDNRLAHAENVENGLKSNCFNLIVGKF